MANKGRYLDMAGLFLICDGIRVSATKPGELGTELTGTEITYLNGLTAGTVTASKALVVDASKDISTLGAVGMGALTCTTVTASGDVAVNTNKFTVTATSGNTAVAGTLGVTGALTPTGGVVAAGGFSSAPRLCHTGGVPATASTDGTDSTPVTTEVYIAEVFVPCNMTITGVSHLMGSVGTNDKVIVALYDSSGTVVANSALAGTTSVGTDAYQRVAFTSPYAAVGPATYYISTSWDGTTDRFNTHTFGDFGASKATGEVFGTLSSITPPTTFTTGVGPIASLY